MFISTSFTVAKIWKTLNCPSTDKWIKKLWNAYGVEYSLALENNEILPSAITWMDLQGIMLSEISQIEKGKYSMLPLTCGI